MPKQVYFDWLVKHRHEIQSLHNIMYKFAKDEARSLQLFKRTGELEGVPWRLYSLLVGAGFDLWRAAFLIDADDWEGQQNLEAAHSKSRDFLDCLLADNAINYVQDKNSAQWTARYYLNSACLRLHAAANLKMSNGEQLSSLLLSDAKLVAVSRVFTEGLRRDLHDHWEDAHHITARMLDILTHSKFE